MVDQNKIFNHLCKDGLVPFSGWDFSYIASRLVSEPLTWSYHSKILNYLPSSSCLLDMGTGGGEFLSGLRPLPPNTYATESYKPNVQVAKDNLSHLGVKVIEIEDKSPLPFEADFFDLIINRHANYDPEKLHQVLKHGGIFIAQQVGNMNDIDINKLLDAPPPIREPWNLEVAKNEFEKNNFTIIEGMECFPKSRLFDIGALIYQLKAVPWQIEDFSLEKYENKLFSIHKEINRKGYIDIEGHRFLLVARKAGN